MAVKKKYFAGDCSLDAAKGQIVIRVRVVTIDTDTGEELSEKVKVSKCVFVDGERSGR